jgi:hypothetical protein
MSIVTFGHAVRRGTHVIITAYGESGCGKTYSLIRLGRGLVGPKGKIGMIDTETGRGLIYANVAGGYEYAELTPPFTPERYTEAIDAAEEAGIEALILDSGSHEWAGLGGVLEIADDNNLKGLVKWAGPKSRHKKYVQRLLNSRMHLLISLRAKEKMVQLTDKMAIPKGMKIGDIMSSGYVPIQDKRFVFETTVQLFLPVYSDRNKLGVPIVEKCPEDLLGAFPDGGHISEDTGRKIAEWVNGGVPVDQEFERLRRGAEEAAGFGTEKLRDHWRGLDGGARDRLRPHADNLGSIARAADADIEERRREQEQSHRSFRQVGDEPGETATATAEEDPFGLPPLKQASQRHDAAEGDPGGADTDGDTPRQGAVAWDDRAAALDPRRGDLIGDPDWPRYADDLVALIGEATPGDLKTWESRKNPHLQKLRTEYGDGFRAVMVALGARAQENAA